MNAIDLSLYLVLDPDLCGGPAGMVRTAVQAAKNGATVVQLRAPNWKKRQWLETAFELKAALAPYGIPLMAVSQAIRSSRISSNRAADDMSLRAGGEVVVGQLLVLAIG